MMSLLRAYYLPNGLLILRMCGPTLILCCLPIMWGNLIIYNLVVQQALILLTLNLLIIIVLTIFLATRLVNCNSLFFEVFHCIVCLIRIWKGLFMHPDQSCDTSNKLYMLILVQNYSCILMPGPYAANKIGAFVYSLWPDSLTSFASVTAL